MFFNLYKYEMKKFKKQNLLFLGILVSFNIYNIFNVFMKKSFPGTPIALNIMFIFVALFISLFTSEQKLFSSEYKDNTAYLMMSLPVDSKTIILSKLSSALSIYVLYTVVIGIICFGESLWLITLEDVKFELFKSNHFFDFIIILFTSYISSIIIFALMLNSIFLSSIVGKTFKKYSKLISIVTMLIVIYLINKFMFIFSDIFTKIGLYNLSAFTNTNGFIQIMLFDVLLIFLSAVLFFITNYFYKNRIQL